MVYCLCNDLLWWCYVYELSKWTDKPKEKSRQYKHNNNSTKITKLWWPERLCSSCTFNVTRLCTNLISNQWFIVCVMIYSGGVTYANFPSQQRNLEKYQDNTSTIITARTKITNLCWYEVPNNGTQTGQK